MKPDANESFESIFAESRKKDVYWEELAILSFTNSVLDRLECLGMSKRALAHGMGVSAAYVTKLMGGSNNFTLRTMAKIAHLLRSELTIGLRCDIADRYEWFSRGLADSTPSEIAFPAEDHEDLALAA